MTPISLSRALLYFHTIRHLKPVQIAYQGYYGIRNKFMNPGLRYKEMCASPLTVTAHTPDLEQGPPAPCSYTGRSFTFLNQSRTFPESPEWGFPDYGRLWTYNLNYFDYLNQESIDTGEALRLIREFTGSAGKNNAAFEPYPISLRCLNWIKFLARTGATCRNGIDSSLYSQYHLLMESLEYHLLGNHLLENGFSLLFGAYYFNDSAMYEKAKGILTEQLREQILSDGGHFELSPMYHQIILHRVLDCVNLTGHNHQFGSEINDLLKETARKMLGWLRAITSANGDIPLLNDSAHGIAPTTSQLESYAAKLGLSTGSAESGESLSASGYRKAKKARYEIVADVGNIGPDYIPGHAHSDTFNFVLNVDDHPLIVDTGVSTYEKNAVRQYERSTEAHNTVKIGDTDQSEVWGGFRVARRARVTKLEEGPSSITATHNGYRRIGAMHTRTFRFEDDRITIEDRVQDRNGLPCRAFLHFHPHVEAVMGDRSIDAGGVRVRFEGATGISLDDSYYAPEFNKHIPAKEAVIHFQKHLITEILL